MKLSYTIYLIFSIILFSGSSHAATFEKGPVFSQYGEHAPVPGVSIPAETQFNVAFDVAEGAEPGKVNRRFNSLARFINMNVAAGVKLENIHLALVVHGGATLDLLKNDVYKARKEADNGSLDLLAALLEKGVMITVCGQSAAAHDVTPGDLAPGVTMSLSAMTAHALLQQQGYTLNPF